MATRRRARPDDRTGHRVDRGVRRCGHDGPTQRVGGAGGIARGGGVLIGLRCGAVGRRCRRNLGGHVRDVDRGFVDAAEPAGVAAAELGDHRARTVEVARVERGGLTGGLERAVVVEVPIEAHAPRAGAAHLDGRALVDRVRSAGFGADHHDGPLLVHGAAVVVRRAEVDSVTSWRRGPSDDAASGGDAHSRRAADEGPANRIVAAGRVRRGGDVAVAATGLRRAYGARCDRRCHIRDGDRLASSHADVGAVAAADVDRARGSAVNPSCIERGDGAARVIELPVAVEVPVEPVALVAGRGQPR